MYHPKKLILTCVLFLIANITSAVEFDSISVTLVPMVKPATSATSHGYCEHRFRVVNRGTETQRVTISLPGTSHGTNNGLSRLAGTVDVPANQTAVLSLMHPPAAINNVDANVYINGRKQKNVVPIRFEHGVIGYRPGGTDVAHVLTSNRIKADIRDLIRDGNIASAQSTEAGTETAEATAGGGTSSVTHRGIPAAPAITIWESEGDVSNWSKNWLAYSRFDGIAMTDVDFTNLQEQHQEIFTALRQYVEIGGSLYVVGNNWKKPDGWIRFEKSNSSEHGGSLVGLYWSCNDNTVQSVLQYINAFRTAAIANNTTWLNAMGANGGNGVLSGGYDLINSLPVLENFGIPVRTILVLIIVFAVLIGPVNIFVLTKMKRRIWLLWTVPLTSIAASMLVYGVNYFQEGFLRQTATKTITILNQQREEALTFGFAGYYSTFVPRGGITFDATTEATYSFNRNAWGSDLPLLEMTIQGGGSQNLSRGWIRARLPSYFGIRKAESRRKERLEFNWEGKPTVTNQLSVDIENVEVVSPDGQTYHASNISAGDKVNLISTNEPTVTTDEKNLYKGTGQAMKVSNWQSTNVAHFPLCKGYYKAKVKPKTQNPFLERGVTNTVDYSHDAVIIGKY
ncbi:MAG: hypothetical protein LBU65_10715 [Planctomycetaceae bacterium]|jgi:hypothetical protein|nr:hypothetical protein [Planctomycetaceae bacterium]